MGKIENRVLQKMEKKKEDKYRKEKTKEACLVLLIFSSSKQIKNLLDFKSMAVVNQSKICSQTHLVKDENLISFSLMIDQ